MIDFLKDIQKSLEWANKKRFKKFKFFKRNMSEEIEKPKTEFTFSHGVDKIKSKISFDNINPIEIIMDFVELTSRMKNEYDMASVEDKKKYFKFFVYGMIAMFLNMVVALWGLGFTEPIFYAKFILGTILSFGLAFAFGKFKEIIPQITSDPTKLKEMMNTIVSKLSTGISVKTE